MIQGWFGMRRGVGGRLFDAFNHVFLFLFALSILYPFWTTLLTSFSNNDEATSLGLHLWIREWSGAAYRFAFTRYGNALTGYANSIFRTVVGTILVLICTTALAYPLAKKDLPGRSGITIYILITMFFSGGLIPTYLLIRGLGLIDNRFALILPGLVGGFNVVIMRNFMMTIDAAYEEAAVLDGANYLQIMVGVIVPLSKPVIATIALWAAVGHWNAWFDALIYMRSESKIVLQLLLRRMLQEMELVIRDGLDRFRVEEQVELPSEALKAAVTMLTLGPIIMAYPFLQRHFVKGIFVGSLKG